MSAPVRDVVWDLGDAPAAPAAERCLAARRPNAPAPRPTARVRTAAQVGFSLRITARDGTSVTIRPGEELWLGRHSSCHLVVVDPSVSRFHACLRWDEGQDRPAITDASSQNGTRLGGTPLVAQTPVGLRGGEELRLGEAPALRVELCHAGVPAPALLHDQDETVLFSDHGPCFAGNTHGQAELHRVLLGLEARRRTASILIEGEGVRGCLTFSMGKVVVARCSAEASGSPGMGAGRHGLRGHAALRRLLELARATVVVRRSVEPEEAELDASVRAVLAQQGEDTKGWARPSEDDLLETCERPSPFQKPIPTPPPAPAPSPSRGDTLFTVDQARVWKA